LRPNLPDFFLNRHIAVNRPDRSHRRNSSCATFEMQPFLSGETTLVYLLTILIFLFFLAAGMDCPMEEVHIQKPVHVAKPASCTFRSFAETSIFHSTNLNIPTASVPKEKPETRSEPVTTVAITDRLRSTLGKTFTNSTWRNHALWSSWSVQGWNFPLWRRNYFGRPKPRRLTMVGMSRPVVMVGGASRVVQP